MPAAPSFTARVHLCPTASPGLYNEPQTPIPSTQLSLILLVHLVHSEGATAACSVEFKRGRSRGVPSMATSSEHLRVRDLAKRRRRSKTNRSVASVTSGVPPVVGFDLAPELRGDGNGDAATASAKTPSVAV